MPNSDEKLFSYFVKHTDKRFEAVGEEFKGVHKKLDKLISLRWMLIGAAAGMSGTISFLFEMAKAWAGGK